MRVLITGASGQLGSEILKILNKREIAVSVLDRHLFLCESFDICFEMIRGFDVVIHSAANTDVEQCELNPEKCYYDNCFFTEKLFYIACKLKAKFVFISSTGVYGINKQSAYHEYDDVNPTTVYHHAKYMAEKIVLNNGNSLVIRTGWLFGGEEDSRKNFVLNRLKEAKQSEGLIYSNTTQIGTPTYTLDCANSVIDFVLDGCVGIYNVVNDGRASRFEYVKKIMDLSGVRCEVMPVDAKVFERRAQVSWNESAISYRMKFEGRPLMRSWEDALADYLQRLNLLGALKG